MNFITFCWVRAWTLIRPGGGFYWACDWNWDMPEPITWDCLLFDLEIVSMYPDGIAKIH